MKYSFSFIILVFLFISCQEPKARKPKKHSTTNFYKELIEENKKLNDRENNIIKHFISLDTINQYSASPQGFWFTYVKKDSIDSITPKKGDLVKISYNITELNGKIIYSKQELGEKEVKIDKQDFIPALHDGIKLMKKGETITFVIPSYRAFGITGDDYRIGMNQTIKSTLTLIDIKTNKNEQK